MKKLLNKYILIGFFILFLIGSFKHLSVRAIDNSVSGGNAGTVGNASTTIITFVQGNEVDISKTSPSLTLQAWNGQEQLGISVSTSITPSNAVGTTNEVDNNIGNGQMVQMLPTADGQGFDVNIKLTSKPSVNVFNYTFAGYSDMNFYYQAPLWQDAGLASATPQCTDTLCVDSSGTSTRPSNVVGSYAVYSKTHFNHVTGQTDYQTGKLFQIYRPLVTDSASSTVWATLNYSNGILSITVPQTFLDNAVYPVVIDPTFGYTTIGASHKANGSNIQNGNTFTNAPAGTLTSISIYGYQIGGTCATIGTFYSGGSGSSYAATILDYTNQFTNASSPQWLTNAVTQGFTMVAGASYSIGNDNNSAACPGSWQVYYDTAGSNFSYYNNFTYLNPPVSKTLLQEASNNIYSTYVTYTASVTAAAPHARVILNNSRAIINKGTTIIN